MVYQILESVGEVPTYCMASGDVDGEGALVGLGIILAVAGICYGAEKIGKLIKKYRKDSE
ncbi:MAG: hypothetical protein ACE5FW_02825 [Candidatus Aenigmatarchaeota archaeon]